MASELRGEKAPSQHLGTGRCTEAETKSPRKAVGGVGVRGSGESGFQLPQKLWAATKTWSLSVSFKFETLNDLGKKSTFISSSIQFSSVAQSCPTLCDPMNRSTPALPVHHQIPESTQTHVHWVSDAIQPSHPLSSPSPPAFNLSQHQGLFPWVNSLHEVARVLEFQLQHQSFQWTPRTDLL